MIIDAMSDAEAAKAQKDRFDALMKLCEFHLERWKVRNTQEWRVPFALWAILIVSLVSFQQRPPEAVLVLALIVIAVGYPFLYAFPTAILNHYEVERAYSFKNEADAVLQDLRTTAHPRLPPMWDTTGEQKQALRKRVLKSSSFRFQVIATSALCLLVYWIIGSAPLAKPAAKTTGPLSISCRSETIATGGDERQTTLRPGIVRPEGGSTAVPAPAHGTPHARSDAQRSGERDRSRTAVTS